MPDPDAHLDWLAKELDIACAQFLLDHQEFASPEGAAGQCSRATGLFLDLLLMRGTIAREGQFRGEWENAEIAVIDGVSHQAAIVGEWIIDWTARQFDPDAPFPLIRRRGGDERA